MYQNVSKCRYGGLQRSRDWPSGLGEGIKWINKGQRDEWRGYTITIFAVALICEKSNLVVAMLSSLTARWNGVYAEC